MEVHVLAVVVVAVLGSTLTPSCWAHDQLTLSGCLRGSGCSQCPKTKYTQDSDGEMLCCPGCASAVLYHGKHPTDWCVCYIDDEKDASAKPKTLKFPGGSTSRYPIVSSSGGSSSASNFFFGSDHHSHAQDPGSVGKLRDALYIINSQEATRRTDVSRAVHQAITLMANTIEDLNARLTRIEDIILHQVPHNQIVNRVGSAAPGTQTSSSDNKPGTMPTSQTGGPPCQGQNFTRIGRGCYYFSVVKDHRAIWEKASNACEDLGAKLAEPIDATEFRDLTQYLSLVTSTTGYSFWIGGLYLSPKWLWFYAGTEVNLNAAYWTGVDSEGKHVAPGDTGPGRCLSLGYLSNPKSYYFAADQCGFEKYYVCELIERSHRRL